MSATLHPTTARPPRGGALDALRFVAALFVVVFHFGDQAPVALGDLHPFLQRGYLATDFFLMLSGFVLAKAYGPAVAARRISLGRFWSKRFVRCYPTHIITLAILAAMVGVGAVLGFASDNAGRFEWSGLPAQILLLHAFGLGGGHWNIPSWTISTLLICYLFFPGLWRAMLRTTTPAAALGLGLFVLVTSDLLSLTLLGTEQFNLPFQWSFFRAAPLFLVGLTLARAVQTAELQPRTARAIGFSGGAVLVANAVLAGPDVISILSICAVMIGCGASPTTRALPFAAWGARVSFCLFMVHTITGAMWFDAVRPLTQRLVPGLGGPFAEWTLWAGALVFTVIAAALYDRFVDAPIQRVLNARLFERRRALRPGAEPVTA